MLQNKPKKHLQHISYSNVLVGIWSVVNVQKGGGLNTTPNDYNTRDKK